MMMLWNRQSLSGGNTNDSDWSQLSCVGTEFERKAGNTFLNTPNVSLHKKNQLFKCPAI